MHLFAKLIISVIELLEAELTSVRRTSFRWVMSVAVVAAAVLMALLGVIMLVYALYLLMGLAGLAPAAAALVSGLVLILLSVPAIMVAVWLNRRE